MTTAIFNSACAWIRSSSATLAGTCLVLAACAAPRAATDVEPVLDPVPVSVSAHESWPAEAIERQMSDARRRLGACGISISVVRGPAPVRLAFTDRITDPFGGAIEGRFLHDADGLPTGEIGWRGLEGAPLDHKQTAAHELGHAFGLGHAPSHAIDLMAPHGCELCGFKPHQCQTMRESSLARRG